ncbi:MAG TPA: glycerate kinase [Gaiellaceae bacterium]
MRALACPASLKGVLTAREAAAALARGLGGDELPLADGGEGTADVLPGVVEAASVIPFDAAHLDPFTSSRPFGELLASLDTDRRLIGLGGTANMDAGEGMLEVVRSLPPATVLCDVRTTLYDAPRLYGPQKGATPEQVAELEARFRANERLAPYAHLPGSGAAGGLGAALASLGAELVPGAATILDLLGFDPSRYDLVVTGEGRVDATTREGKVPYEVARRCVAAGVRCVVFGGIVDEPLPGVETVALSGDPSRAEADLEALGARLLDAAG